jgi:hypothetical protein
MTSLQVRRTQLQSPNNRPFILNYSLPNSTASGKMAYIHTKISVTKLHGLTRWRLTDENVTRPTARHHTTWRLCMTSRRAKWRSAGKADAAQISEQNIQFILKYSLPNSTTSKNMPYTLRYQIPNYSVSQGGCINTTPSCQTPDCTMSQNMQALHDVTKSNMAICV